MPTLPSDRPSPCVVLFVADVARLTDFYRQLAQMQLLHQEPSHAVLELQGLELVIHALPYTTPSAVTAATVVREDAYSKLCLPVPSVAEAREIAKGLGGAILPPSKEWAARGFRACDGHDPEGNVIQVRELATR